MNRPVLGSLPLLFLRTVRLSLVRTFSKRRPPASFVRTSSRRRPRTHNAKRYACAMPLKLSLRHPIRGVTWCVLIEGLPKTSSRQHAPGGVKNARMASTKRFNAHETVFWNGVPPK